MARDARFWRNVAIVAAAHVAVLIALMRSKSEAARSNIQEIVWISGGAAETAPAPSPSAAETQSETTPPPIPDEPAQSPEMTPASDIQLPTPTPTPTPKPSITPTPVPRVSPTPTAKPTPKASPKKTVAAKEHSSKKETAKKKPENTNAKKKEMLKVAAPGESKAVRTGSAETKGSGTGSGTGKASEFKWYGDMLHDRFYKEWEQPKSVVATGAKMSVVVKIRIEKDGRVSSFTILKPSGNVVVDESVAAVAKRVTQVDPLPQGLGARDYYEVNINFAFNADK